MTTACEDRFDYQQLVILNSFNVSLLTLTVILQELLSNLQNTQQADRTDPRSARALNLHS